MSIIVIQNPKELFKEGLARKINAKPNAASSINSTHDDIIFFVGNVMQSGETKTEKK